MYKLTNGNMVLDLSYGDGKSRFVPIEHEEYKQWLSEGNTPEPEFTEAELAQQELIKKVQGAKEYLASTDFKMTVDYYATLTKKEQTELTKKRAEARSLLV